MRFLWLVSSKRLPIQQNNMTTLRTQILNRLKEEESWVCGAELERMEWKIPSGGLYKPSTVARALRLLTETQERVKKDYQNGTVFYKYILSRYETYHNQQLV